MTTEEKAMSTVLIGCSDLQHTVFLQFFSLITVLNIMNSISMGVSAKLNNTVQCVRLVWKVDR